MPFTIILVRLSTLLLVPLVVLTGLGASFHDGVGGATPQAISRARALVDSPESSPAEPAAAAPAEVRPRSLYLAVGHGRAANGRWQPGAQHPGNGAMEVDAAQVMVDAMVEVLQDAPGVRLISESGDHPNYRGSRAAANAAGVDDCIEVHQDSATAPPGAFAHWYPGSKGAHRLADGLVSSIRERGVPFRSDWHRPRPGLHFLRETTCRAVLVEVGRVGDYGPAALRKLGRGMAQAYLQDTAKARGVAPE